MYALVFLLGYSFVIAGRESHSLAAEPSLVRAGAAGLCVLFALQLVLSVLVPGHKQDISLFRAWAAFSEEHAVWEYYTTELYVDYPPVYLYVLYLAGLAARLLHVPSSSPLFLIFVKFIPILFDALTTLFVFRLAKEHVGEKQALVLAFLSAVNPMNIVNATIWGQADSVTTLVSVFMLFALYKKQYIKALALFAALFLTKPQMIVFAPVLGFVIAFDLVEVIREKKPLGGLIRQLGFGILAFFLVLLLVPLPITGGHYGLLIENYKKALGLYPYATLNAANLFGMLGGNWANYTDTLFVFSYKTWGFLFIIAVSLLSGYLAFSRKNRETVFVMGTLLVLGVFMLGHTMHERYSYPALLILLCTYILTKDKKTLFFYGAFSLTGFISCAWVLVLNWKDAFIYGDNVAFRLLSFVNVLLFFLWAYHILCGKEKPKQRVPRPEACAIAFLQKEKKPVRLLRIDYLLMLVLTLFYAVFGFYNLGSRAVPETGWYVEEAGEQIVLDLGEETEISRLHLFVGWMDRRHADSEVLRELEILSSHDGESWEVLQEAAELHSVFRWHSISLAPASCRYVKLSCDDGRFYINEAALFGKSEQEKQPIAAVLSGNETAQLLVDEQDKVTYAFSWYDGTYFDEIYHPRTAYEYIHGLYPYENTHPPLGKVIIACGILLFGMNPFGWRFFGTLCGVLMVPLVYIMGKKMLRRTRYAAMAAFIFSFDFMHLAQTRLATIDSYTAFFVMGMYLFMFLYIEKDFYRVGVRRMLPLFLSGLCFGLGAAVKWQGIYAGIGLAFLFFFSLGRRFLEYQYAKKHPEDVRSVAIQKFFPAVAAKTIAAGFLFFVVVPIVIYFCSYLPIVRIEGTGGISYVLQNQETMLSYHANLTATHPYGSSWWQWPLDYKPLYAYGPNRDFVPEGTSMGITSFGNPLIWWLTIPVVLWALCRLVQSRKRVDWALLTMVAGFFSLYVPWMFVTRTAYIYHFFPCVVFVVLMLVRFAGEKMEQKPARKRLVRLYMTLVFILFLLYYPLLTGIPVPSSYAQLLRLLPGWVLG